MKNWKKAGIGALCVAVLLAGCGMQDGKDDGNGGKDDTPMDVTLETLREVNDPCMLLEKYDAVTVNIQGTDRDGEVAYTARLQYTDGGDSTILMSSHYSYTANSGPGEDELWCQGNGSLYATRMASDDSASLNIYPIPGEGTEYLLEMLPQCTDPAAKNAEETLDERSEQDGAVLLSTTTRFQEALLHLLILLGLFQHDQLLLERRLTGKPVQISRTVGIRKFFITARLPFLSLQCHRA